MSLNHNKSIFDEKIFNLNFDKFKSEGLDKKNNSDENDHSIETILEESLDSFNNSNGIDIDEKDNKRQVFDDTIFNMNGGNFVTDTIYYFINFINKINFFLKNDTTIRDSLLSLVNLVIVAPVKGIYNSIITQDNKINKNSPIVISICTLIIAILNDPDSGYRSNRPLSIDDVIEGFSTNLFYLAQIIPFIINKILRIIGFVKTTHTKYKLGEFNKPMKGGLFGIDDLTIGVLIVCCIFIMGFAALSVLSTIMLSVIGTIPPIIIFIGFCFLVIQAIQLFPVLLILIKSKDEKLILNISLEYLKKLNLESAYGGIGKTAETYAQISVGVTEQTANGITGIVGSTTSALSGVSSFEKEINTGMSDNFSDISKNISQQMTDNSKNIIDIETQSGGLQFINDFFPMLKRYTSFNNIREDLIKISENDIINHPLKSIIIYGLAYIYVMIAGIPVVSVNIVNAIKFKSLDFFNPIKNYNNTKELFEKEQPLIDCIKVVKEEFKNSGLVKEKKSEKINQNNFTQNPTEIKKEKQEIIEGEKAAKEIAKVLEKKL
jgi:hypothetical protein